MPALTPSLIPDNEFRARLFYVYDPMCSWCWGFRPVWDALTRELPENIEVVYVAGGLAPDSEEPMSEALQQAIQGYWRDIQSQLGTEFNFDFWVKNQPRRSTYLSCRAVIAADRQGALVTMHNAIQQAYYLRALNPSDVDVLVQLAQELKLDAVQFEGDLRSGEVQVDFEAQLALARQLPIDGFPSLVLEVGAEVIKLDREYQDHRVPLRQIQLALK
ncbi:DsbA family protein [Pseudomaricurvus hydrocarbonicus]|nr:DsbA family protein [Aestuariicella hydrocarbonica]